MLSVLPNIPVVIQPKFAVSVLGSGSGRNSTHSCETEGHAGIAETHKTVVEAASLSFCGSNPSGFPASLFTLSKLLNTEQFKDSPGFLQFICNSNSHLDSAGTTAPFMSGGLQRYLIESQCRGEVSGEVSQSPCQAEVNSDMFSLLDLPDSIQLHIFAFLDAKTLCAVACVCRHWSSLSCDILLWRQRLEWDVDKWNVIGDNANPDAYKNCSMDWNYKEIYLRCSPEVAEFSRQSSILVHRLSSLFRSLLPKKDPRVAMFGPGLESRTSGIVRNILENSNEMFMTIGMFPGQFGGVGSGFKVKVNSFVTLDLITIYNATKKEREQWSAEERLIKSRMLAPDAGISDDAGQRVQTEPTLDLQKNIKDLCQTLDGLIFVVDATVSVGELSQARPELFAMANDKWMRSGAPVLILSCTPNASAGFPISCRRVVQQLQLHRLNRPWQVRNCSIDTMQGFLPATNWIVETCQRK